MKKPQLRTLFASIAEIRHNIPDFGTLRCLQVTVWLFNPSNPVASPLSDRLEYLVCPRHQVHRFRHLQ